MELPLFPLNTVLFPGALLPLKIFEARYMDMAKQCLRESSGFGVCLIKEGREVGAPATPESVGCTARIIEWDMPQLGVLHLLTQGEQRFRLNSYRDNGAGLLLGSVELFESPGSNLISEEFKPLSQFASDLRVYTHGTSEPNPAQLQNAGWVSDCLSDLLPLPLERKQQLLALADPSERLALLHQWLREYAERSNVGT